MNITEHEMRGLLAGKCLPGDMRVNEELPAYLVRKFAELKAERDAMAAENVSLKSAISYVCDTDNQPDYQYDGMGCGIEDRGIIDRYEAARYGWDEALERIYSEVISFAEDTDTPATDAYLNSVRAEGADKVAEYHFVRIDALKEVSRQGHLFHKAAYSDAVNVANLFRAGKDGE